MTIEQARAAYYWSFANSLLSMLLQSQNILCLQMQEGKEQLASGPRRAHAGIMSAATAIWKDLRAHRILPAMLDVSDDSSEDDSDNEQYDIAPGEHSHM